MSILPPSLFHSHGIVLGKTRAGKSSVLRGAFVEPLLNSQKPVTIIDPKGDWWGIKSSADGKHVGYPVVIFGGDHADVPINEHSGKAIAELVATGNRPALIDLGGWMPGERSRFFVDFASTLFRLTRGQRWLIIDEVHNFTPQGKVQDPLAGKVLHWTNRLINEGSGKGLTIFSASQRPQKVHKDFVTANETLIAMRVIHPLDRAAMTDWMAGVDPKLAKEIAITLSDLNRGEGWAWSPESKFGPVQMQFPMFSTYDSFKPQTGEATTKLKGWASVDLDDVRTKLAAVVEEAKANDPVALKVEIARLRAEARKATPAASPGKTIERVVEKVVADPKAIEKAEKRGIAIGHALGAIDGFENALKFAERFPFKRAIAAIRDEIGKLDETKRRAIAEQQAAREIGKQQSVVTTLPVRPVNLRPATSPAPPASHTNGAGDDVSGPQRQLLRALAWWKAMGHHQPSRPQVAGIAGWKITSGHLKNVVGSLRTAGLVEYPTEGRIALTSAGAAAAPDPDMSVTLHDGIRSVLSNPQRQIFDTLLEHAGELAREDIATACGWEPTSGHLKNIIGSLRTLEIVAYPTSGRVALQDWVTG